MFENVKTEDWARLAAYIDSEGCIYICRYAKGKPYPRYQLLLDITNTDPRLMVWVGATFDGVGSYSTRPVEGQRPRHAWRVGSKVAASILKNCLPYFVMKRDQAELAIAFQETKKYGGRRNKLLIPTENLDQWEKMYVDLRSLKTPPQGRWMERVQ